MSRFALADTFSVHRTLIGEAQEPVLVIDNVMRDWRELVDAASGANFAPTPEAAGYPGIRAPLPKAYAQTLLRRVIPMIIELYFAQEGVSLSRFDCNFSMVTRAPDELHPLQTIPHVDIARPNRIAILHFLCDKRFGGTAFYRQNASGLEIVGPKTRSIWLATRASEARAAEGYPSAQTPGYSQHSRFSARPDRILIYRSHALHSGLIPEPEILTSEPKIGRLTANFFCNFEKPLSVS